MEEKSLRFDIEGFDGGMESFRVGDHIVIAFRGYHLMGFDVTDLTSRDLTIASLLRAGFKGKLVAELCHTGRSRVSEVNKVIREGGCEAIQHLRRGRKAKLVGEARLHARRLRRTGSTIEEIAEEFGVSIGCAFNVVRGIPRGSQPQQEMLVGVNEPSGEPEAEAAAGSPWAEEKSCTAEIGEADPAKALVVAPTPAGAGILSRAPLRV